MVYTPLSPPATFTPISSSGWGAIVSANFADHETRIAANTADLAARGRITAGYSATGPTNVTTTQTAFHVLTGTLVGGRPYRYKWCGNIVGNGATGNPYFGFTINYIAGGSFTVAGSTQVFSQNTAILATGHWENRNFEAELYAPFTGTFSVAVTVRRLTGVGGVDIRGDATFFLDCTK